MSVADVVVGQAKMSEDVNTRLQLRSQRVDVISESIQKVQKETPNNSEVLHTLLVGMENLGNSFK